MLLAALGAGAVAGLLVAVAVGIGLEQSLGVFYTALYFRAAHNSRPRLFAGVAVYFTALATGSLLAGGLTDSETTLLGMQAMGLCFTAFPMSVVLGSLLARGQELTRERQLLEAVLDSVDVAVVACDREGRPRHDNGFCRAVAGGQPWRAAFAEVFGLSTDELYDRVEAVRRYEREQS